MFSFEVLERDGIPAARAATECDEFSVEATAADTIIDTAASGVFWFHFLLVSFSSGFHFLLVSLSSGFIFSGFIFSGFIFLVSLFWFVFPVIFLKRHFLFIVTFVISFLLFFFW